MKTEELKTGFWGYKKFSVYQYITTLEEQFSAKLLEKDLETRTALDQAQARIQQLEQELSVLRQQYEEQQSAQMLISNTLLEAQRYADMLKKEAEARDRDAQQQHAEALEKREEMLRHYDAQLQQLRETFRSMLQEMDGSVQDLAGKAEALHADGAEGNLSLFHRKSGPVA